MNEHEFVAALAKGIHSLDFYVNMGFSAEDAAELLRDEQESCLIIEKPGQPRRRENPIERLIHNYDVSKLEIGMIRLGQPASIGDIPSGKIPIGLIEADPLVINEENGEIELLDHTRPDFVMARCAVSSENFMEALLLLASFVPPYIDLYGDLPRDKTERNNSAAYAMAAKCAAAAGISGGDKNIYEMLLGCE